MSTKQDEKTTDVAKVASKDVKKSDIPAADVAKMLEDMQAKMAAMEAAAQATNEQFEAYKKDSEDFKRKAKLAIKKNTKKEKKQRIDLPPSKKSTLEVLKEKGVEVEELVSETQKFNPETGKMEPFTTKAFLSRGVIPVKEETDDFFDGI